MSHLPDLPSGVYQHYKGPLYLVLGYGHDSNDNSRDVVVYVPLHLDANHPGPRLAVRTASDFHALVHVPSGLEHDPDNPNCSTDERVVPRFRYVGPAYDGGAAPARSHT